MQQPKEIYKLLITPRASSITAHSNLLPAITFSQQQSRRQSTCFGDSRALVNLDGHGKKLDLTPIQKTPVPNFGVVIGSKHMSLLTSSAAASTSVTCSDGLTGIPSRLKRRVRPLYLGPIGSGLPPTFIPKTGSPPSTMQRLMRYLDA